MELTKCTTATEDLADINNSDNTTTKSWFPLESNPDALNRYISRLGFNTLLYQFVDVYSTEDWALEMIPGQVLALLLVYPITPNQEKFRIEENESLLSNRNETLFFMKQRIGNACGTIGILHALTNLHPECISLTIDPKSWLGRFYQSCWNHPSSIMTPIQIAERLEQDPDIGYMHSDATMDEGNQTHRGDSENQDVDTHFIALVPHSDGYIYEFDGRKEGPVRHGCTTKETFLKDACQVVQRFMDRDPEELRFTIVALTSTIDNEE